MGAFSAEEKKKFRFKKFVKEKALEFALIFIKNIVLTEIVVWAVGSDRFLLGLVLALGYSVGWMIFELLNFKKEGLDIDIKDGREEK